jgi:GNAT superfamily N-acetyltransferase
VLLAELDRISDSLAASVLAPLSPAQRERLLRAQAEVRCLLAISMVTVEPEDPGSLDARWCLQHYFAELAERFGLDPARTLPAGGEDVTFLLARIEGQPAGCGMLRTLEPGVGELQRMWVDRPQRGLGIAGRLLGELEARSAALGHRAIRLYTHHSLDEAQALYRSRGYVEIPRYNTDPYASRWFEKRVAGP